MLRITRSGERYHFETDWLSAYWHFSFDHYYDPENVSFGPLRVFNNDTIQPGKGFPMHPHRDMEILTYVIRGALEHNDSTGGSGVIHAGEVQRMSAGTGVRHSEFNASRTDPVELVQIWILPRQKGVQPSYEQKRFSEAERTAKLLPIASGDGKPGTVYMGQDADLYVTRLEPGQAVRHELAADRRAYLFVIDGALALNGEALGKGDSVRVSQESELKLEADAATAEALLIDLP